VRQECVVEVGIYIFGVKLLQDDMPKIVKIGGFFSYSKMKRKAFAETQCGTELADKLSSTDQRRAHG